MADRRLNVGEDDLLAILDVGKEGEGRSIAEIAREKKRSQEWVRREIHALIQRGEAEFAGNRRELNMAQRASWVPVYRRTKNVVSKVS